MNTDNPSKDALLINIQCLGPGGTPGKEDEKKQGVPSDRRDAINLAEVPFQDTTPPRAQAQSPSHAFWQDLCTYPSLCLNQPPLPPCLTGFLTSIARTLPQKASSTEKSPPQEGLLLLLRQTSSSSSSFPGRLPPPLPPPQEGLFPLLRKASLSFFSSSSGRPPPPPPPPPPQEGLFLLFRKASSPSSTPFSSGRPPPHP